MGKIPANLSLQNNEESPPFDCYEKVERWEPILYGLRFWIEGVALSLVGIIGLAGNVLSLLVLTTSDRKSSFNSHLVLLAVADSFFLLVYLLDVSYIDAFGHRLPEWYKALFPLLLHPLKAMLMSMCIYMIVAIAANRFRAICYPMMYK